MNSSSQLLYVQNFINGQFVDAKSKKWLDNIEPATGAVYGKIPDSNEEDVKEAVKAAKAAFPAWSKLSKEDRAVYLYRIADLIEKNMDRFVEAESRDNGKTLTTARTVDIPRSIHNFRFFAGAILHHEQMSTHHQQGQALNIVVEEPLGVAALISPWNLPIYLLSWKIAPAIAVGNTCVCKPSELTPVTAWLLSCLIKEAGLPDGVVNVVHGLGATAGHALVEHPDVSLISFTGGTATGKTIAVAAAKSLKRVGLELGGKNPNIIFEDCDMEKTIATTVRASFANQGEICLCCERVFVQRGIYDKFLARFVEETKKWKVGSPEDPSSNMGAIISEAHLNKIKYYVDLAKDLGASIEAGGNVIKLSGKHQNGFFFEPTIITGLTNDCRVCQEEIFGPVVAVIPFDTEEEVIQLANDINYGLSATVFTENVSRAQRVSLQLQTGTVWVNTWLNRDLRVPFGGAKMSGIGREGGKFSYELYCDKKTICLKY